MRWLSVGLVLAAGACGGSEQGALLVLDGPEGVISERLEVVLISTAEGAIVDISAQRVQPTDLATEPVRYYRQRAVTGAVTEVGALAGFQLRLEPNEAVPEAALIPFLISYDDQDRINAIGAALDASGNPAPIEIIPDQLVRVEIAMQALVETDGASGIGVGQAMVIDCDDFTKSGIAWQPGATQLRLLLPDRSQDPDATDASERALDMDCDREKPGEDCDDLRSAFHPDAVETCDGMDMDCDNRLHELVACNVPNGSCNEPGVAVCADVADPAPTTCQLSPECACALGICLVCDLPFEGQGTVMPCAPVIAKDVVIADKCESGCEVEVLPRPGDPWRVEVAATTAGPFGDQVSNLFDKVALKITGVPDLVADPGDVVGGVFLHLRTTTGESHLLSFALQLQPQNTSCPASEPVEIVCRQL